MNTQHRTTSYALKASLTLGGILFALGMLVIAFMTTPATTAQTPGNLSGYAWSNVEGVGWISMSCENDNSCATNDYQVSISSNGNWSGRGWSSNVGWINFAGNPSCGSAPSTDMTTGKTHGFAYLESSSGASSQDHGAITGCITMSGQALDGTFYGVEINMTTGQLSGYAWSGHDVQTDTTGDSTNDWQFNNIANVGLGWIDFANVTMVPEEDVPPPPPGAVGVNITNFEMNVCRGDDIGNARVNYINANTCSLSGSLWQSPGVFLELDEEEIDTNFYNAPMVEHTDVAGVFTGTAQCVGVPDTDTATTQVTVNYLDDNHPLCDPEDVQYFCDLNPTHEICQSEECIADPSLPQCNPGPIIPDFREQ